MKIRLRKNAPTMHGAPTGKAQTQQPHRLRAATEICGKNSELRRNGKE